MNFDPNRITFFAKTDARGANVPFGIKAGDRTKHIYVIGKTGMGKSTLLENMAVQDIQNGEGLAFIDPHGQTAEKLLDYIPEHRKDDVLYFAPFDTQYPVAFNVMEDVGPDKRHLVVSGLMSVFKKIWVDAWSARMEYILSNTLLALLEYPDSTLLGVNRMLSEKHYRRRVIDNITDPSVKSFWEDEFLNYNERYMQEAGDAIKNKIGQFTANPLIRNIIGQPKSSFDLRQIMDERKIIIMNLSKGLVGETNANLLGSMLTTRIYLAAMSRADLSQKKMQEMSNFYFYVDEFQSFANATFADILSEARKYKLNLTIAHQYIEQMEEEVRNAVFGNVGTTIAFRVGPFDAEILETIFSPQFLAVDICNLGFAQIYLSLMIDGVGSKPFSATTLPPIEPKSESCKDMVIHRSREQFARNRAEVEAEINLWHLPQAGDSTQPKNSSERKSLETGKKSSERRGLKDGFKKALPEVGETSSSESDAAVKSDSKPPNKPERSDNSRPERTPRRNPEKSLDDLRSVLKSISKTDTDSSSTAKKSRIDSTKSAASDAAEIKNKAEAKPAPHQPLDLKQALANVLEKTSAKEVAAPPKSSATDQPPMATSVAHVERPAVNPPSTDQMESLPRESRSKRKDPLDPKLLERMMRVTTSDKPPLK